MYFVRSILSAFLHKSFEKKSALVVSFRITSTFYAIFNLTILIYFQVLGASWYLLSIERYTHCWKSQCKGELSPAKCYPSFLDCDTFNHTDRVAWAKNTTVFSQCDPNQNIAFQYGIFENAVTKNVVSSNFIRKYFYCLWWGLQQLRYVFKLQFYLVLD